MAVLVLALAAGGAAGAAADGHAWAQYVNARFQYAICYPADLLVPQGEAENGDGQTFVAKDGARLTVYGGNNALGEPLKAVLDDTRTRLVAGSGVVTYEVLRPDWFVVSGQTGPTVFYAKTRSSHDQFKSFEFVYRQSDAALYDPLVARIAGCFKDLAD